MSAGLELLGRPCVRPASSLPAGTPAEPRHCAPDAPLRGRFNGVPPTEGSSAGGSALQFPADSEKRTHLPARSQGESDRGAGQDLLDSPKRASSKPSAPQPRSPHRSEGRAGTQAQRQLRGLAAAHGVPVGADTPPADLIEPLLAQAGDDAETVREIREAETALARRAVVTVTRHRTVGVHLDAHGVCVTTRTRRWVLIRADSAAASAAVLAALGVTVTADSGSECARTGEMPAGQAPPDGPVIQP